MIASRFASLAVLAVLTFLSLGAPVLAQGAPAQPNDLVSKLSALTAQKGEDGDIPGPVAVALGLTDANQNWVSRQLAASDSSTGVYHGFATHDGTEDVLFIGRAPDSLHVFRAHRDGKLVAAVAYNILSREVEVLEAAPAQSELDAQVAFWNQYFAAAK